MVSTDPSPARAEGSLDEALSQCVLSGRTPRSTTGKDGTALLQKRPHAFVIISAIEASHDHRGNRFHIALLRIPQALANRNLRRRHRERRVGRHLERIVANILLK